MTSDPRIGAIALPDTRARRIVQQLLEGSGVALNGSAPWDMQVLHPDIFSRMLHQGTLGLGEAYMEGWWECDRIDEMIHRMLRHGLGERAHTPTERMLYRLQNGLFNLQSKARAYIVGEAHYDLGNDLFERMLDPTLCYSCAYWKEAETLHQAQVAKLDLAARKLNLAPGMKVLDIGCGWGSFAEHAARHYGVKLPVSPSPRSRPNWHATAAKTCQSRSTCRTTASSKDSTIESFRSACSSMLGIATIGPTSTRSLAC